MKKLFTLTLTAIFIGTFLWSCGSAPDPDPVEGLETYTDAAVSFELQYPSNWDVVQKVPGERLLICSNKGVVQRFAKYDAIGNAGAKIDLTTAKLDSSLTLDDIINNSFMFHSDTYKGPDPVTIDGVEGKKYTFAFELNDGVCEGELYFAQKDEETATIIALEAFGGTFQAYRKTFDEIIGSAKLAITPAPVTADTIYEEVEADPPSETFRTVSGNGFSIKVPDNFSKERGMYMGQRRGDSYLKVDVTPAEKTTDLGKLVAENKKKLPGAGAITDVTIGAEKGKKITYNPSRTVAGEMFFVLKNKKLYRVTINWFKGDKDEEKLFKPILQKCALTLKVD